MVTSGTTIGPSTQTSREEPLTAKSPFHNAPDPELFFETSQHSKALETLTSALRTRRGLFLLMGEIGTGKTTLCRYLQRTLPADFRFGQISNPFVSPREFEDQILREFGLADDEARRDFFRTLGDHLMAEKAAGRTNVLLIDEGHLISLELFDHILILSNIQHDGVHLLQIILAGQPELQEILKKPRFASLNQRISTRIFLTGLSRDETGDYIRHRLGLVPKRIPVSFSESAVDAVWKASGGIPRLINHICERSLTRNFEDNGGTQIDGPLVRSVLADPLLEPLLPSLAPSGARTLNRFYLGLGVALALCLVIIFGLTQIAPEFFGPVRRVEGFRPARSELRGTLTRPIPPAGPSLPDTGGHAPGGWDGQASADGQAWQVGQVGQVGQVEQHQDGALEESPVEEPQPGSDPDQELPDPAADDPSPPDPFEPEETPGNSESPDGSAPAEPEPPMETPEPAPPVEDLPPLPEPDPPAPRSAPAPKAPAPRPSAKQARGPAGQNVRVNAIVWHADPAQRMAVIDGEILREGKSIDGIKVVKINRSDVEFEYQGSSFTKSIQNQQQGQPAKPKE
jgi:type II secretory pathway predicted ATPase ExeA